MENEFFQPIEKLRTLV